MNKTIKILLFALTTISSRHMQATSNKTFLSPRPVGINLAMESLNFNKLYDTNSNTHFGGNLEVTAFYAQSANKTDLGNYFSPTGKKSFTMQTNNTVATNGIAIAPPTGIDINAGLIIYDCNSSNSYTSTPATVTFNPSQELYGAKFSYSQNLDKFINGLYLQIKLPVVHIKNKVALTIDSTNTTMISNFTDYFNGTLSTTPSDPQGDDGYIRFQLANALIDGKYHSKTAPADITFNLGYTLFDKESYKTAINLYFIAPTGNKAEGRYTFEPIAGNGGHLGIGIGYAFTWQAWSNNNAAINLNSSLDWHYLFKSTERRTFGIIPNNFPTGFGQYATTTQYALGSRPILVTINPIANVTTVNAQVRPGNILDGTLSIHGNYASAFLDIGLNLFYKDAETVRHSPIQDWLNNFVVSSSQPLNSNLAIGSSVTTGGMDANKDIASLTNTLLDDGSAASAHQFSKKIYGELGYTFKGMTYPLNIAAGGHYEFAANNATIANWGIHCKTGISF